eukprot:364560-Chlamydomonas_euryale.AAC.14
MSPRYWGVAQSSVRRHGIAGVFPSQAYVATVLPGCSLVERMSPRYCRGVAQSHRAHVAKA